MYDNDMASNSAVLLTGLTCSISSAACLCLSFSLRVGGLFQRPGICWAIQPFRLRSASEWSSPLTLPCSSNYNLGTGCSTVIYHLPLTETNCPPSRVGIPQTFSVDELIYSPQSTVIFTRNTWM
ncbi:hypothetical protein L218DRAFT_952279 [Marasmius fiardii PR-910]|nr:hypothetical protein L218DRAFT_952279 [Marasmius fiardii PR-910]